MSEKTDGNGKSEVRSQNPEDDRATDNDVFRIDRLTLKNFRCFEEKTIDFHPRFNVLIGDNGKGKTAVCDALAVALRSYVRAVTNLLIASSVARPDDIRLRMYEAAGAVNMEPQQPCSVSACATFRGEETDWWIALGEGGVQGEGTQFGGSPFRSWERLGAEVRAGSEIPLPLVAYYRAERLWAWGERHSVEVLGPGSRLEAYANWAAPAAALADVLAWVKTHELTALQEKRDDPALAALKRVVKDALSDVTPIEDAFWSVRLDELVLRFADGTPHPLRTLSHGWATTFALLADLTRRCTRLNPYLGTDAAKETPGVVLIDEIDLHLHPSWQRKVVDDLKRAFPKVQFIVTTHSPIIVQSLRPGELIKLDGEIRDEYADKSVEDVLEATMGIDEPYRSERYQQMARAAKEYQRLLRRAKGAKPGEREKLKRQLDELVAPFSDNIAYHAFLEAEREAAGLGDGDS
jgi:predicted ATP-binding protein involved in virulence